MCLLKMRWQIAAALFLLSLMVPARLQAEEEGFSLAIVPNVRVVSQTEANHYQIGQIIPFKIVFTSNDVTSEPVFQVPELPLQNLTVVETSQAVETRIESGYQVKETVLLYKLKAEKPGKACVNSFGIDYKTSPESMTQHAEIETHCFDIEAAPWFSKISKKTWLFSSGAVTLFAAFSALSGFLLKRKPKELNKILSEEDQCLGEMDAVVLSALDKANRSEILKQTGSVFRRYLSSRYMILTPNIGGLQLMDTIERRRDIPAEDKNTIRAILEAVTECTFGGVEPSADEVLRIRDKVRTFIANKRISANEAAPIKN